MVIIFTPSDIVMFNMESEQKEFNFCASFSIMKKNKSTQKVSIRNTSRGTVIVNPSECSIMYEDRKFDFAVSGIIDKLIEETVYGYKKD